MNSKGSAKSVITLVFVWVTGHPPPISPPWPWNSALRRAIFLVTEFGYSIQFSIQYTVSYLLTYIYGCVWWWFLNKPKHVACSITKNLPKYIFDCRPTFFLFAYWLTTKGLLSLWKLETSANYVVPSHVISCIFLLILMLIFKYSRVKFFLALILFFL
jgi:hypothetical protein